MAEDPDRRGFLKVATCALGGGLGIALAAPALRLVIDPATQTTVTTPTEPIDLGPVERFRADKPVKVDVLAPLLKDAWTTARDVVLGGAWIHQQADKQLVAYSAVCPHLGCGIGFEGNTFVCPCHDSKFALDGGRMSGPSKRGLDPLPLEIVGGRLRLTWVAYKMDTADREKA